MLRLPPEGFRLSTNAHNSDLDALVEWIEGSVTFVDKVVTRTEVVDILTEEEVYRSQDFARAWVEDAWIELARRAAVLGAYGSYSCSGPRVRRCREWLAVPAFSFCLLLALQVRYREELGKSVAPDYPLQGALFERLTQSALEARGLRVYSTAWSKVAAESIQDRVAALAGYLGERVQDGGLERWAAPHIKDGGLDIVCHFPFPDGWGGRPLYFVQCASGADWKGKKATPQLNLWEKLIDFTTKPQRGVAMPFALLADEFRREANYDQLTLLLDRHRLAALPTVPAHPWPEPGLVAELRAWTGPRAVALPQAN